MKNKLKLFVTLTTLFASAVFAREANAATSTRFQQADDAVYFIKRNESSGATGNITLIKSNGMWGIIDAGDTDIPTNRPVVEQQLRDVLGIKDGQHFDLAMITHLDQDHYNLFTKNNVLQYPVNGKWVPRTSHGWFLDKYTVGTVYLQEKNHRDIQRVKDAFNEQGTNINLIYPDRYVRPIQFGDFTIRVWNNHVNSPEEQAINKQVGYPNENFNSLSITVEKNGKKLLIGGDMSFTDEKQMIASGEINQIGKVDVFALNHHGTLETQLSKDRHNLDYNTNSQAYISRLNPGAVIFTAGKHHLDRHYNGLGAGTQWENQKRYLANLTKNKVYYDFDGTIMLNFSHGLSITQGTEQVDTSHDERTTIPANEVPIASTTRVYRVHHPKQGWMLTSKPEEVKLLQSRGWKNEGTAFMTTAGKDRNKTLVYRLYNPKSKTYFMTTNQNEIKLLQGRGWVNQGIAFQYTNSNPTYRVHKPGTQYYLYTANPKEVQYLQSKGWRNEGRAFVKK